MKKNKLRKSIGLVIFLLLAILTIAMTKSNAENSNKNEIGIKVEYEYNEETNQVLAKIVSDIELKDTKPTWDFGEDKKTYTKIFISNMDYTTLVEDINGNVTKINIKIQQVKPAKISMDYVCNEETNQVLAKIISNTELKKTKPTWKLSDDKKVYTKIFTANTTYQTPVEDINGNIIMADIKITQIEETKIKLEYEYNKDTNKVTAKIISNMPLQDTKPTWKLSDDKKIYTKIFDNNIDYTTPVKDVAGNEINVNIKITQVDKVAPKITYDYTYNKDGTVTMYLKSNEPLGDTKPTWKLSKDKLTYEKVYESDQNYYTQIEDIYGNSTTIKIKLKMKKIEYPEQELSVGYIYTADDTVIVQIMSDIELQDTKPTWKLSEDKMIYTKIFTKYEEYTTPVTDINDVQKNVKISVDFFYSIKQEKGTYGMSGAKVKGVSGGSDLEYYRFGNGENVLFATFCIHGYEDSWDKDGTVLVNIANDFYNRLVNDADSEIAKKWTIYILKEVNPDGRKLGSTENGPGRTTVYSKAKKGIDINRSWPTESTYKIYTNSRNYNGTEPFQAYEAEYLRDFLLSHKSKNGQNVLVDLHGWEDQLIGDEQICKYYKEQYTSCRTTGYGRYGTQYLITWARQNLGAKVSLVEMPLAQNEAEVNSMKLSEKYIQATINMLKGI